MPQFSSSARSMRSSEIRRLMKLAADPQIISFAGGMPNNDLFPVEVIDSIWATLPPEIKQAAFQYGPTSGYPPLIAEVGKYLVARGIPTDGNELLITTGAQQAISLIARVMVDPGDIIITEYPCFIGAIAAFKAHGARLIGVQTDRDGIVIDSLRAALESSPTRPKFLYLTPYFHNPAGIIYSDRRKQEVLEIAERYDLMVLEDDPYGELYFEDADSTLTVPMKAHAEKKIEICYVGSFAKIFGPGMRLGWLLTSPEIIAKCELAKQSADACSSSFTQVLAAAYLGGGYLPPYLAMLRETYRRRAAIMLKALEEHMPPNVSWTTPRGGFYVWVTLPDEIDATSIFEASLARGAAFVIGSAFDPDERRNNCFRLAFSHTPEDRIAEGVRIICQAVAKGVEHCAMQTSA